MLTDGTGALTFLRALVGEYLSLLGVEVSETGEISIQAGTEPDPEEWDDSFKRYKERHTIPEIDSVCFHVPFPLERKGVYHLITGYHTVGQFWKKLKHAGDHHGISWQL
jgi:hypothetical protein